MTTETELKPCPFEHYPEQVRLCGNLPPELKNEHDSWWVQCSVCGTSTVSFLRPKSAALFWNRRIPLQREGGSVAQNVGSQDAVSALPESESVESSTTRTEGELVCSCGTFTLNKHERAYLDSLDLVHTAIACPEETLTTLLSPNEQDK